MKKWFKVSIPLSRDSHCNSESIVLAYVAIFGFNPSIEGQPLQPQYAQSSANFSGVSIPLSRDSHCNLMMRVCRKIDELKFQSLYRGTAIATSWQSCSATLPISFNPSIEGQPLQQLLARS